MAGSLIAGAVLEQACAAGVIPVAVIDDPDHARPLGESLKQAGLPVVEVTLRTSAAVDALRVLASDDALLVGAGTVVLADQVDGALDAGARFVVTPGFSRPVIERCRALGLPVIPGVSSASDLMASLAEGIRLVKFFPAEASGGVVMVRALHAPFADVRFVPTGGINTENAASYLALPWVAAVGGSWMVAPKLLAAGDFAEISRLASDAVRIAGESRP